MIRFVLHAMNVMLILAMIGCIAGALAGLVVLLPFVAGAWGLNLAAILAYERSWAPEATPPYPREVAAGALEPTLALTEPTTSGE